MKRRYGDRVEFLAVYVREAHPTDGWRMASNDRVGIAIAQPRNLLERTTAASKCCTALEMTMPVLVDGLDDRVGHLYSGMPDRLYVLDRDGRVAFKSGRGPFGFKPGEMEQSLLMLLLDQGKTAQPTGWLQRLENAEAWKCLPAADRGTDQALPSWARQLARPLPATTAAMLELDYLHRARSPLDPQLRGKVRWVAAHANRCTYGEACAAADLRRAGVSEADVQSLAGDFARSPAEERATLRFARKMTLAASTVTDAEVAELRRIHGDKKLVALVLLLAYSNFQDRLLLALDAPVEQGGPLPPLEVHVATGAKSREVPARQVVEAKPGATSAGKNMDPEWLALDAPRLQKSMSAQREREPRIPVPAWEEVRQLLPDGATRKPLRIRWSLVCVGYQPELANAWSACTRAFAQEAKQDRVFEESLFWVITRSLQCFY